MRMPDRDLTGYEYPAFTVLRRISAPQGGNTVWECRCKSCGALCQIPQSKLALYKSCGCLSTQGLKRGRTFLRSMERDGTSIPYIKPDRILNKNNSTGIKGVCLHKQTGKYRAYIVLRGRQISLGLHDTVEEAAQARKHGEEKYFSPEIDAWEDEGNRLSDLKGPYKRKTKASNAHRNIRIINEHSYQVQLSSKGRIYTIGTYHDLSAAIAARDKARADLGMKPIKKPEE